MTEELNGGCLDEREEFEAHMASEGWNEHWMIRRSNGDYLREFVQESWKAWRARASLSTSKQAGAEPVADARTLKTHARNLRSDSVAVKQVYDHLQAMAEEIEILAYATPPAVMPAAPSDAWLHERADELVKRIHARIGTWGEQRKAIRDAMQEAITLSQTMQPQAAQPAGQEQAGAVPWVAVSISEGFLTVDNYDARGVPDGRYRLTTSPAAAQPAGQEQAGAVATSKTDDANFVQAVEYAALHGWPKDAHEWLERIAVGVRARALAAPGAAIAAREQEAEIQTDGLGLDWVHSVLRWAASGYVHTPERMRSLRGAYRVVDRLVNEATLTQHTTVQQAPRETP